MSEEKASRLKRFVASGKGKTLAVSVAILMAFSLGMASTAVAANGMPFTLGKQNVAKAISTLKKQGPGPALSLVVGKGQAPLKVNSSGKVKNLNADKVDGLDAKDLKGKTGPRGSQGQQGEQGEVGPQGVQGPQGEQGNTGAPGEDGTNGTDGNTILSGRGAPSEPQGNNGDYYIDNQADELYGPKTNGVWGGPVSLEGPRGQQGPQGEQGEVGPQGEPGEQGPQGETGDTGPQGEPGQQGETGEQGPQGIQGETGAQGAQGEQGATGAPGEDGTDGTDGNSVLSGEGAPAADFGFVGDFYIDVQADEIYGPKSAEGWDNPTSLIGPQGEQGQQGEQGTQGAQGEVGPEGPQGEQGEQGEQGPQGETGPEGPSGSGTSENTPNSVVGRDGDGNFSAGTITADVNGNAATASNAQALQGQGAGAFLPSARFGNERPDSPATGSGTPEVSCYVGEILLFAGNYAPTGTLFADGQVMQIKENELLWSVFGNTYGGDGQTTFQLPDLNGLGPGGTNYIICTEGVYPERG